MKVQNYHQFQDLAAIINNLIMLLKVEIGLIKVNNRSKNTILI
jgi:hypothetical protein